MKLKANVAITNREMWLAVWDQYCEVSEMLFTTHETAWWASKECDCPEMDCEDCQAVLVGVEAVDAELRPWMDGLQRFLKANVALCESSYGLPQWAAQAWWDAQTKLD